MKTTVRMTLVKPAVNGMEPDTPLPTEPEYVTSINAYSSNYRGLTPDIEYNLYVIHVS